MMSCIAYIDGLAQQSILFEHTVYEQFIQKAKKTQKPVLLYFTGTGCYLCVKMEKTVFIAPDIYEFYNQNFISVESFDDANKPDSATKQLRRKYGIVSNPTFIFIDTSGKIIHKAFYKDKNGFFEVGKQALGNDNYRSWSLAIKEGGINPTILSKYLSAEQKPSLYAEDSYRCPSQEALDKYFTSISKSSFQNPENWDIIQKFVENPYSNIFKYVTQNQSIFNKLYGEASVNNKIYDVLNTAWSGNTSSESYKKAETFITQSNLPMAKLLVRLKTLYYANLNAMKNNKVQLQKFLKEFEDVSDQYSYLMNPNNIHAVVDFINKLDQREVTAAKLANKLMKNLLSVPANEYYDYYDTYAKTFLNLKDFKNAVRTQEKAIEMAKKDEADQSELKMFYGRLAEYKKTK